jgi:serine/threonine-protein kinase HipA
MKYMIGKEEAKRIINEVKEGVSKWKPLAIRLGIAKREMEVFAGHLGSLYGAKK